MKNKYLIKRTCLHMLGGLFMLSVLCGCENGFLDAKPNKAILVPTALEHYQALLDNARDVMNSTPYLGEVSADDFYMAENTFESYEEEDQNAHVWAGRIYPERSISDWDLPYKQIFYANVVLEGLKEYSTHNEDTENLKGSALFYRGWALFHIAQLFGAPYNPENAAGKKGVPVRISADVTLPSEIGSLQDTYERIRSDLEEAIPLLPVEQPVPTRPSKAAGYALMARLSLVMQEYGKARQYADSTLALQNELIDYNTVDPAKAMPFPGSLFKCRQKPGGHLPVCTGSKYLSGQQCKHPGGYYLYRSYSDTDLRKLLFFDARKQFRGSYMGQRFYQFSGLAVDEMVLTRAEANVRTGNTAAALNDLNSLLLKRWQEGKYEPLSINDPQDLLERILTERRKELVGRGIRWGDLKRLNQEVRFEKVLKRNVNGKEYTLPPHDSRYALPFPDSEGALQE